MADMDFVRAKSILDHAAQQYRAAQFLADALETAASLDKRGQELSNNVKHLAEEEQAAQARLDALNTAFEVRGKDLGAAYAQRQAALQAEHDVLKARLLSDRQDVADALAQDRKAAEYERQQSRTALDVLEREIQEAGALLAAKKDEIEAIKALARQVTA